MLSIPSFVIPPLLISPFIICAPSFSLLACWLGSLSVFPPTADFLVAERTPPQQFSQHGLSLFTPRHYQQWTSCKQHLLLLARPEKKKPAIWITPTMKRRRQRRPSGGRRLKVVHHTGDAISVALYIKQAPSLILNPIS